MSMLFTCTPVTPAECEMILAGEWPVLAGKDFEEVGKYWDLLYRVLLAAENAQRFAANAIRGGYLVDGDGDFGSAYLLTPDIVARISVFLDEVNEDQVRDRYQTADLRGAYHENTQDPSHVDRVVVAFMDLRDFFHQCALAGNGVVRSLE